MPITTWTAAASFASFVTGFVDGSDSGDPVPFAPAEGRWMDWLGLSTYVVLFVAVCLVAWRLARAPEPSQAAAGDPTEDPTGAPGPTDPSEAGTSAT